MTKWDPVILKDSVCVTVTKWPKHKCGCWIESSSRPYRPSLARVLLTSQVFSEKQFGVLLVLSVVFFCSLFSLLISFPSSASFSFTLLFF